MVRGSAESTQVVKNDPKGVGAFLLAAVESE
jgi:hypothetical protein